MGKKQGRGLVENKSSFSFYTFRKFEMFTVIIKFLVKKDADLCWAISPTQYKMKVFLCLDPCLITNVYIFLLLLLVCVCFLLHFHGHSTHITLQETPIFVFLGFLCTFSYRLHPGQITIMLPPSWVLKCDFWW